MYRVVIHVCLNMNGQEVAKIFVAIAAHSAVNKGYFSLHLVCMLSIESIANRAVVFIVLTLSLCVIYNIVQYICILYSNFWSIATNERKRIMFIWAEELCNLLRAKHAVAHSSTTVPGHKQAASDVINSQAAGSHFGAIHSDVGARDGNLGDTMLWPLRTYV